MYVRGKYSRELKSAGCMGTMYLQMEMAACKGGKGPEGVVEVARQVEGERQDAGSKSYV